MILPTSQMPQRAVAAAPPGPKLSIVVPALNEQDNVVPLVEQVDQTVRAAGIEAELVVVDDGSTDQTLARLTRLAQSRPWLHVLHRATPQGQSAALHAGIQAATGTYIATLDADLQNDPADLPKMLDALETQGCDMVQGDRSRNRRDNLVRRTGSVVGRRARGLLLGDRVRDTGCSARVVRTRYARQLPLHFKGMHRFFPICVHMMGGRVVEMAVGHRPRAAGTTKYGLGVLSRGWTGLLDALAVRWMISRFRNTAAEPQPQREHTS